MWTLTESEFMTPSQAKGAGISRTPDRTREHPQSRVGGPELSERSRQVVENKAQRFLN
jgi:hypothetical protein